MAKRIDPPKHPAGEDEQIDCEASLDDAVRELVDDAIIAGWRPDVVFKALRSVVENRSLAYAEDPDPADDQ